jgi:SAM-dependent methyltransferase
MDLGCGCGRHLAGWEGLLPPGTKLYGLDINPELIAFCQENIKYADSILIDYAPPISYVSAGGCDLLYAASVFTHIMLGDAKLWAAEVHRLIAPGGIAMISFNGTFYVPMLWGLSATGAEQLFRDGFYCNLNGSADDTYRGANSYTSFMTKEFFCSLFEGFDVLYLREGFNKGASLFAAYQDIAILRRK